MMPVQVISSCRGGYYDEEIEFSKKELSRIADITAEREDRTLSRRRNQRFRRLRGHHRVEEQGIAETPMKTLFAASLYRLVLPVRSEVGLRENFPMPRCPSKRIAASSKVTPVVGAILISII
jgi:hypothetical protein